MLTKMSHLFTFLLLGARVVLVALVALVARVALVALVVFGEGRGS